MTALAGTQGLQQSLADAADAKLVQVVALVDAMGVRGDADRLIAPLRSRLLALRPPRPLRMARLLYQPMDPLIVATADWQPGSATIPRGLLPQLTKVIEEGLGVRAQGLANAVRDLPAGDDWAMQAIGQMLWPQAGRILAELPPLRPGAAIPNDTGLVIHPAGHPQLVAAIAVLLNIAPALGLLAHTHAHTPPPLAELRPLLQTARAAGPLCFQLLLALLLASFAAVPGLLNLGEHLAQGAELGDLIDRAIGRLEAMLAPAVFAAIPPAELAGEVRGATILIEALGRSSTCGTPVRRGRLVQLAATLHQRCSAAFDGLLHGSLLQPLASATSAGIEHRLAALEVTARDLRRLNQATGTSAEDGPFTAALADAADQVSRAPAAVLTQDRARLVEILVGPNEAAGLLAA